MRRLDHLCCETCYQFFPICTSLNCGVFMQRSTHAVLYLYVLAYFVAKKGEKNGNLYSLYACVCLHLFCSYVCFLCCCNYFRLCVDVVTDVTTS